MKAQVGKEKFLKQENTQYIETNDNEKLCNLVIKTNMVRSSTKFMHLKRNKANQKSCSQIGYVLINKKKKQSTIKGVQRDHTKDHVQIPTIF